MRSSWSALRRYAGLTGVIAAAALAAMLLLPAASAAPSAAFTTVNDNVDVTVSDPGPHCLNGNPAVNCNIYTGKNYVWLNGGPLSAQLADGMYVFAVLAPGGQGGNQDPNDGTPKNLSDLSPTTNTGAGDDWTHRVFSVSGGTITYPASGYPGGHDFDSSEIRLMPYDDTPNPGGVYIMAICSLTNADASAANAPGVDPSACKYDAFKVRSGNEPPPQPNQVASCFSGTKYRDDNKNGQFDDSTETGLQNWTISIDPTPGTNPNDDATATTDANGNWSWCEPSHDPVADASTTYTIKEVLQNGWKETGNTVDQSISLGGATTTLNADMSYSVNAPQDANASADDLNFGNIPQGSVTGAKYYDANTNGVLGLSGIGPYTALEALLSNWRITQTVGQTTSTFTTGSSTTDANGYPANFSRTLDPGTYTFTEVQATNSWIQTGNTASQTAVTGGATASLSNKTYTVLIPNDQPSSVSGIYFGNVCLAGGGGLTMGFWSNNNGQAIMKANDNYASVLAFLDGLYLRNGTGANFDPTTYTQYRTWLLGASATNMAYMLAAQLSAMELNVRYGKVNGGSLVYAPGAQGADANGFVTINNLMWDANTELGLHGLSVASGPTRTYQEALKTALDKANNNLNFVQSGSSTCPTPAFP
jgi:hypothetical protein